MTEIDLDKSARGIMDENIRQRDEHAMKLGVATAEYERAKSFYMERIARSVRSEQSFAEALIRDAGFDPAEGTWSRDGDKLVKR